MPLVVVMGGNFYEQQYLMSAVGMAMMWLALGVFTVSMSLLGVRQHLREKINLNGFAYRKAIRDRNFSEAWFIVKDNWDFSLDPARSGMFAKLNRAVLLLAPVACSTVLGGLLR